MAEHRRFAAVVEDAFDADALFAESVDKVGSKSLHLHLQLVGSHKNQNHVLTTSNTIPDSVIISVCLVSNIEAIY